MSENEEILIKHRTFAFCCNLEIWFITRYAPLSLITTFLGNGIDPFYTDLDYIHLFDDER